MGAKYSTKSVPSGYNQNPPSDDGAQTSANKVKWSTIKTKLADQNSTHIQNINTALVDHFDEGPNTHSSAHTTTATDFTTVLEVTGTTTISLGDASTLGSGYKVGVKNAGSNTVTVTTVTTADGVDGDTSVTLRPSEFAQFMTNASANGYLMLGAGVNGTLKAMSVFTASGTWTKAGGVRQVLIELIGAGGGGGGATSSGGTLSATSGGGGGGGYAAAVLDVTNISSATVTVGAGGSGGSGGSGSDGGLTSWSDGTNTVTATGGAGGGGNGDGNVNVAVAIGGAGGTGTGGQIHFSGSPGQAGFATGDGNGAAGFGGFGGSSKVGGGAIGTVLSGAGTDAGNAGLEYGGGGSGGVVASEADSAGGGAGAAGVVIVWEFGP